jgi:hypothetical protein
MSFVNWVGSVLQRLVTFLQPVLDFLRRVAAVVRNILRLPYEFGARIWNAIPACIRDPFIDFFIPLILRQIPFFAELGSTPEAWQQTRASIMLLVRQIFRDFDLWGAMRTAFGIVVRALRIPIDLIRQLIEKASRAWSAVLAAPIRFIRSALQAILRGMGRFVSNFLSHLWFGVQGWLFNAVSDRGITPPSSWTDFRAVFGFVLDVLGISLDHVLDLLATRIGRPAVARIRTMIRVLTGVWEWVSVAIREGPAGIWRMIVERLRDLGNMVLETAVRWVMTRIMAIVGARLAAMAASAGLSAILEAIYAAYQAIQTAIEYARRIIQVLITVFDTVIQIAQGVIDPAAQGVETGLRMIMPVVIGFLANYAGLGGIGQRIREIIDGVRERVDQGILWLIDRALAAGRWILDRLRAGVAAVVNWWTMRRRFRQGSEEHTLYFEGEGPSAQLMVRTTPTTVPAFLVALRARTPAPSPAIISGIETELNTINTIKSRTDGNFGQADGDRISASMNRIADLLVLAGDDELPLTHVDWTPTTIMGDPVGERMVANPLSPRPGTYSGSAPYQASNLWTAVNRRQWTYVRGHLLNHHLYGPGNNPNLVPIDRSLNTTMSANVEEPIKHEVLDEHKVVKYSVQANFSSPWPNRTHLPAEALLPRSVSLRAVVLEKQGDRWDREGRVIYDNTLPVTLPPDTAVGSVRTLVRLSLNNPGASAAEKLEALQQLDRIGPDRALAILNELGKGRFRSWDDLQQRVSGVTNDLIDRWRTKTVTVPDPAHPGAMITRRLVYFDGATQWDNL